MDKDHPGNMLKQELIQIQIIRYLLPALLNFLIIEFTFYSKFYFFQIVFEGIWGNSRVSGYVAIDDITFFEGDCSSNFTF